MRAFTTFIFGAALLSASVLAKDKNDKKDKEDVADVPEYDEDIFAGFECPEPNGLFAHIDQCDAYYVCEDGEWEGLLCEDGYVFDDSKRNHETCKLPHGIECGERVYLQTPSEESDATCPRANGIYPDKENCGNYYLCDKGTGHKQACVPGLVFDNTIGSCVRKADAIDVPERCLVEDDVTTIDGFACPATKQFHQGIVQAHPVYAHPHDCQFFFSCLNGKTPMKLGCGANQAFDEKSKVCKVVEDVAECSCWYECLEDSDCPTDCNADCTCPSGEAK